MYKISIDQGQELLQGRDVTLETISKAAIALSYLDDKSDRLLSGRMVNFPRPQ